jgi:SagB-type dehydrogenase family enzyme
MDEELLRFVRELHFETDKAKPPDWEADWDDAPLPYKLYRGQPTVELASDYPLTLLGEPADAKADARHMAYYLGYAYGIAQVSRVMPSSIGKDGAAICRRVVPSGGGLYPNELYVYLKLQDLPRGIYHYDAAHHRLVLLREGDCDDALEAALGWRYDLTECFGAVFVTTVFWKNFFKYFHFSYRLQGLDAGVLLGQLLESGKRFGYRSVVCYQFIDRAAGRLLGLREGEESVYAIALLSSGCALPRRSDPSARRASAEARIRSLSELNPGQYVRSRRIRAYPLLVRMDEASRFESAEALRTLPAGTETCSDEYPAVELPVTESQPADLALLSRKRYSPETDFVLKTIDLPPLAGLLRSAWSDAAYRNDLSPMDEDTVPYASLLFCAHGVSGLDDGAYLYDARAHRLRLIRRGDMREWLQYALTFPNVNLSQVPLIFHLSGDLGHHLADLGPRGYRIQQMEAGMLLQRLLLRAAASGWAGRPLLSYDAEAVDDLYRLPSRGETALVQVPIGPYLRRARWEGALFR